MSRKENRSAVLFFSRLSDSCLPGFRKNNFYMALILMKKGGTIGKLLTDLGLFLKG